MSVEVWIVNVLKIVFVIVGMHIALTKVLPLLKDMLSGFIGNKKINDGITGLIAILILVLGGLKIFDFIEAIGNKALSYLLVFKPGFEMVFSLEHYFKYIVLAVVVAVALKAFKKA